MIEIKNLSKIYNARGNNRVKGLNQVSVSLEENGFYVLYGKSGAGKSTFMNTVGGLDSFDGGSISFGETTFSKNVSDSFRTANIGYIFQNYCLDEKSNVYENVAMGLRSIGICDEELIFERTMTALANVGMQNCYKRSVTALSGGQQQRVAIARVMAKGCKIILADEPTGNLDEENSKQVLSFLKEMSATRVIIVVTHETDIVRGYADKVIEIADGAIQSVGEGGGETLSFGEKQNIYLNEFPKTVTQSGDVTVEQYGTSVSLRLRIINDNGKLYLSAEDADIQVIGKNSEIRLIEKSREDFLRERQERVRQKVKELAPLPTGKIGSVFTFRNSYGTRKETRGTARKRDRFLKVIVAFLMISILLQSGFWGSMFRQYSDPAQTRMGEVVHVSMNPESREAFQKALEENSSLIIESACCVSGYRSEKNMVNLGHAPFESNVSGNEIRSALFSWILPYEQAERLTVQTGKRGGANQCLISKGLVLDYMDYLRRIPELRFHSSYEEFSKRLIGLQCELWVGAYVISGIVQEEKSCAYFDSYEIARNNLLGSEIEIMDDSYKLKEDTLYLQQEFEGNGDHVDLKLADGTIQTLSLDYTLDRAAISEKTVRKFGDALLFALPYQRVGCDIYVGSKEDSAELTRKLNETARGESGMYVSSSMEENARRQNWLRDDMIASTIQIGVNYVLLLITLSIVVFSDHATIGKTVGIYRAIGVSKKNILFRYFCKNLRRFLMFAFGIFLFVGGFLVCNTYFHITILFDVFSMLFGASEIWLSWWQWLAIGATVLPIAALISLLPVVRHLRKTPAKLLGQHDL